MEEHHFYASKIKDLVLLIICCVFTSGLFYIDFEDENLFIVIVLYLGMALFSIGIINSVLLLIRTKPLLTVTDQQIIVYNVNKTT